jgi:hypothetical protein
MEFSFELSKSDESVAASISNSFREMSFGLYYCLRLGRPFYRTIGALPVTQNNTRTVTVNETIDRSVFERIRKVADYEPRNLAEWSHRLGLKPEAIVTSVRADDGSPVTD